VLSEILFSLLRKTVNHPSLNHPEVTKVLVTSPKNNYATKMWNLK